VCSYLAIPFKTLDQPLEMQWVVKRLHGETDVLFAGSNQIHHYISFIQVVENLSKEPMGFGLSV
jgi:hypothetical protein